MDLAGFAAAVRVAADRAEAELAMVACAEGSRDFLAVLRMVTPKRSGALMDSETVTGPTGSGAFAVAEVGPHIIYAEFRNEGGTISAKVEPARSGGKYPSGKPRRHSLHWPGGFAMHVTQAGSHYMERAEAAGRGAVERACQTAADRFISL